jgi:hypothetical protein
MLTIIPERPLQGSKAQELASALRADGCEVWVDEGYGNEIHIRGSTGYQFVVFLYEVNYHRNIVTLSNRWENTDTNIPFRTFIRNWRSYLEED